MRLSRFCVPPSRPAVLLFISFVSLGVSSSPSRLAVSSYIVPPLSSRCYRLGRRNGHWRVVLSVSSCHNCPHLCVVIALASSRLVVSFCVAWNGTACVSVLSVGHFLTRYARLVSSCLVGGSVSWRGACGENELTKTARFAITVVSVSSGLCSSCHGDANRARSNGSETMDRCRSVRPPGLSYMPSGRFRQSILSSAHPPT